MSDSGRKFDGGSLPLVDSNFQRSLLSAIAARLASVTVSDTLSWLCVNSRHDGIYR
jgi:hypothetical protein